MLEPTVGRTESEDDVGRAKLYVLKDLTHVAHFDRVFSSLGGFGALNIAQRTYMAREILQRNQRRVKGYPTAEKR